VQIIKVDKHQVKTLYVVSAMLTCVH